MKAGFLNIQSIHTFFGGSKIGLVNIGAKGYIKPVLIECAAFMTGAIRILASRLNVEVKRQHTVRTVRYTVGP